MVAHLVRLKLTLLRNGFRRSVWQTIAFLVGVLYAVGVVVMLGVGLVALSMQDADLIRTVVVLAGALVVAGWWFIPLVAFGVDETLDPRRFVTLGVPRRTLMTGLSLSALVGVPGATTVLLMLAAGGVWWRTPAALVAGVLGSLLAIASCVLGSRALTGLLAPVADSRRFREVVWVLLLCVAVSLGPLLSGASSLVLDASVEGLRSAVRVASWTPWGAPWAAPADAAQGDWGPAVARLALAAAVVVLLAWVWGRSLERAMVSGGPRPAVARRSGLGLLGRLPATPAGAVAARCLIYWRKDPRYASSLVIVPVLLVVFLFVAGTGSSLLLLGPIGAVMLGLAISVDLAFDSSAFALHLGAGLRGRDDRLGRVVACAAVCVPLLLVLVVVSVWVGGRADALLPVVAATVALFLSGLGVSSVISARVVHQVPKPGENPFAAKQSGGGLTALLVQAAGTAGVLLLSVPALVLAGVAYATGSVLWGIAALVVGVVLGAVVLGGGVRIGGRTLDRDAALMLQRLVALD